MDKQHYCPECGDKVYKFDWTLRNGKEKSVYYQCASCSTKFLPAEIDTIPNKASRRSSEAKQES